MQHVSHKLSNSFEGALAGGGDPATSPLYVFGPFLKLIVAAGVARVTFGASIWLVVFTVIAVSAMYRLVMKWVVDGSGGSGLNEEEFGGWAVKVNAGITFAEYTLTFLVSMAALVTFLADRFPFMNDTFLNIQPRTVVAIVLTYITGWLVNRGPKTSARVFGPATAGVLILLWAMVIGTIWQFGFRLPSLDLQAFTPEYLGFTLGGYARILALMTGIEVFANLVAAYSGNPETKSRRAFGSLVIIMGTTSITMLIVGPAILELSDPANEQVSVFTQTMDQILPAPLPYLGTLVGVIVLLSASAASAQGLQNLALGLRHRHYVPSPIGERNRFDVADKPVWVEVTIVALCFLLFGTSEETYLAIYAAGVFILLSMTGWAASKRLIRELRAEFSIRRLPILVGTIMAAFLSSAATVIIFEERFYEGAWTYFVILPILYVIFTYFRRRLGPPTSTGEALGRLTVERKYLKPFQRESWAESKPFQNIFVALDGSAFAERALPLAHFLGHSYAAKVTLVSVDENENPGMPAAYTASAQAQTGISDQEQYLGHVVSQLQTDGLEADYQISQGQAAEEISALSYHGDLIVMSTHGRGGIRRWFAGGSVAKEVAERTATPLLLLRPTENWRSWRSTLRRILVPLDGSEIGRRVVPYVKALASHFGSEVLLLSVAERPESDAYVVELKQYLESVASLLRASGLEVETVLTGSEPAPTIIEISKSRAVDVIMMATHGRGGFDRLIMGSVSERVIEESPYPVFLLPVKDRRLKFSFPRRKLNS